METEPEILVETEAPKEKTYFGFSRTKIIILVIVSAVVAAFLIVGFLVIFKYLGFFSTSKKATTKGCKNCKDKKPLEPVDGTISEIDKMISENNTKIEDNQHEKAEDNPPEQIDLEISERQKLLEVEVKNEDVVVIDETTDSSTDSMSV